MKLGLLTTHQFLFEPRDLWIGVYWDRKQDAAIPEKQWLFLYICFVPTLVWKITSSWCEYRGSEVAK